MAGRVRIMAVAAGVACAAFLFQAPPSPAFRVTLSQPEKGEVFPDFSLPDATGKVVSLSEFQGKVSLLSFWSCYVDTCFTSAGAIEKLLDEFSPRGLVAPTVCSEIPETLSRNGYAGLLDKCGRGQIILIDSGHEMKGRFHIRRFPTSYLIGPDLTVKAIFVGVPPLHGAEIRALIEESLRELP